MTKNPTHDLLTNIVTSTTYQYEFPCELLHEGIGGQKYLLTAVHVTIEVNPLGDDDPDSDHPKEYVYSEALGYWATSTGKRDQRKENHVTRCYPGLDFFDQFEEDVRERHAAAKLDRQERFNAALDDVLVSHRATLRRLAERVD